MSRCTDTQSSSRSLGWKTNLPRRHKQLRFERLEDRRLLTLVHPLELSSLLPANGGDGTAGFAINETNADQRLGFSVRSGNINGDQYDDMIISATGGDAGLGNAYVIFGRDKMNPFPSSWDVSQLVPPEASGGPQGFRIHGTNVDTFGVSVAAADLDNDGVDDVIISAWDPAGNESAPGRTYVLFGGDNLADLAVDGVIDTETLDGSKGFVIHGTSPGDLFGSRVSSAGDINNDGFEDMIIANNENVARAFVVFGGDRADLQNLHGTDVSALEGAATGFEIQGGINAGRSFPRIASGHINNDLMGDVIFSSAASNKIYVVFGQNGPFPDTLELENFSQSGVSGFAIENDTINQNIDSDGDPWEYHVAAADMNGDDLDDVIAGGQKIDVNSESDVGQTYLVFGGENFAGANILVSSLDGSNGYVIDGIDWGDHAGSSVGFAGNVNGDEAEDLIIGARGANLSGQAYVVFGGDTLAALDAADSPGGSTTDGTIKLSSLNGETGFALYGRFGEDNVGPLPEWVESAGDMNGDGYGDLLVGFNRSDPNGAVDAGRTYVVYGDKEPKIEVFSNENQLPILDNNTITSTITIPNTFDIQELKVRLDITHTRDADLDVFLSGPSGPPVELFTDVGKNEDNFTGTILYDDVDRLISDGSWFAPFTGFFRPEGQLSVLEGANVPGGDYTLTITDDKARQTGTLNSWSLIFDSTPPVPPSPSFSIDDVTVTEGNAETVNATFTVTRAGDSSSAVNVQYATQDNSATAANDYTAVPATTLNFVAGETSKTIDIIVHGDTEVEQDETFFVNLTNASPGSTIADGQGVGTIANDDQPPPSFSIDDVTVTEGDSATTVSAIFTVTRAGDSSTAVSVQYATQDNTATAPGDYTAVPATTLAFTAGQTSGTISITVNDDALDEGNETFFVDLSSAVGATIQDSRGVGTIADDDAPQTTRFYVVDSGVGDTFEYAADGTLVTNYDVASNARGATANVEGTTVWVVDSSGTVHLYDDAGGLLGSWTAGGLSQPAGIATDGTDIWIVDDGTNRVYRYDGAASLTSGSQNANSNFKLKNSNKNPRGITTDGTHLWVVNNGGDKVFKYSTSGSHVANWTIDGANANPRGITIDPSGVSNSVWIVDNIADKVFEYTNGKNNGGGTLNSSDSFNLAGGNDNPQGIADPPPLRKPMLRPGPSPNINLALLIEQRPGSQSDRGTSFSTPTVLPDLTMASGEHPHNLAVDSVMLDLANCRSCLAEDEAQGTSSALEELVEQLFPLLRVAPTLLNFIVVVTGLNP